MSTNPMGLSLIKPEVLLVVAFGTSFITPQCISLVVDLVGVTELPSGVLDFARQWWKAAGRCFMEDEPDHWKKVINN